ncbi:class I SAM-dependent methyltransferase [Bradyrhizobium sp. Leo121]|uniref:class I SAM-dependent methyltransferase n=1 Tax=Bradyrhizobium sp. Leo121 TaxID=1571195 RepID=UPI00102A8848|nr:class I SAM-dependent methyltransferase [Bradyrhizobium sp. Leo121]RZN30485.1 hypothetical protein CWO90_20325 [Bradyrhizobium sp. Leo121]
MVQRGANHLRQDREFYRTPPKPTYTVMNMVQFGPRLCDPCCGDGAMLRVFCERGHEAFGADIHPVGVPQAKTCDFLADPFPWGITCDIITNPPYGQRGALAVKFIERALQLTKPWRGKVAMLLPVDFDSAVTRSHLFGDHPAYALKVTLLYRIKWFDGPAICKKCNGTGKIIGATGIEGIDGVQECPRCDGLGEKDMSPAENHAWFVWDWKSPGMRPVIKYAGA